MIQHTQPPLNRRHLTALTLAALLLLGIALPHTSASVAVQSENYTGAPKATRPFGRVVADVEYRDFSIIDHIGCVER